MPGQVETSYTATPLRPFYGLAAATVICLSTAGTVAEPLRIVRYVENGEVTSPFRIFYGTEGREVPVSRAAKIRALRGKYRGRFSSSESFLADRLADTD